MKGEEGSQFNNTVSGRFRQKIKVRFGETPKPTRETRALPGV